MVIHFLLKLKRVDQRKLDKAEAKLKQKIEKRENKQVVDTSATYDASKSASASQSLSKKAEIQQDCETNRSFDISIENFDVSFGNK